MAKPRLAPAAQDDLREIRRYSKAVFGTATAVEYIEGVRAVLHRLGDMPLIGSLERDLGADVRGISYRSHRIYYRVSGTAVLIVRVLHQARDARTIMVGTS